MRPLIGITQDAEYKPGGAGFWAYLDHNYAEAVYRFGGLPVMLPLLGDHAAIPELIAGIDGLILSGGDDIHPRYYGEEAGDGVTLSPDLRTDYDFALLKEAMEAGRPVLGICLGVQEMNVYFGGTLHQDISGHKAEGGEMRHEVTVKGGRLLAALGPGRVEVNSFHHQAIKGVAPGLTASAVSDDGVVEAVELPGERYVLGVQWHPERMRDDPHAGRLFTAFIAACSVSHDE